MKYFSIDTLNDRIESFNYGPTDIRNRPTLTTEINIKRPGCLKMSASEMLCFMKYFGLIIGDMVSEKSELWDLYIVLKKILDIIFCKWIRNEDIILLESLITEHHELYLRLFCGTNLKPKHHHMVHYPFIIKNSGPLSLFWSMRFEAKHRELKETANSITSRKNITLTLSMKQQLKYSYKLLAADTNLYTSNIKTGPIISLSNELIQLYILKTIFLSEKVHFSGDDVIFVSWVSIKGILYNCKNMSVVLNLCEEYNYMLPSFGLIQSICITNLNKPFAICKKFNTQYFDEHFQAFNVMSTQNLICISLTNLQNIYPSHLCTISNGLTFIPLKL